ncbi:MAG: GTP pyrophosphokinase family protein [Clostridia bacterium]|nr:GTP pyrophosphokinase family protein [Clostridia bacterium]MDD6040895.1 GTP pyrophosphokinase family protein [Clostridia bacterium]
MKHTPVTDLPPEWQETIEEFLTMRFRYQSAMREVRTKLEILDDEFSMRHSRNPIHHMESRIKTPNSILQKLRRKGLAPTPQSAMDNLHDIAGIRVVCAYLNDTYAIAELLGKQDDLRILRVRDYIKCPKPNGYRSLHLIVEVPVFLSSGKELLPVEVQIRTIAMDFWASLEHQLRYKEVTNVPESLNQQLCDAAERIAALDSEMQHIHDQMLSWVDQAEE